MREANYTYCGSRTIHDTSFATQAVRNRDCHLYIRIGAGTKN